MSKVRQVQAAIVGGGLAGLAAAVAVGRSGLNGVHLSPPAPPDRRTSALMMPTVRYLQSEGLVADPAAIGHPLTQIRIIDATDRLLRAPETLFDSADAGLAAFGWNFSNVELNRSFSAAVVGFKNLETLPLAVQEIEASADGWLLTLSDGSQIEAELVVGADGKKSRIREQGDFRAREHGFVQAALVCDLELSRPLNGASVEFHYPDGPFTLVPAGDTRANLVWIDDRQVLEAARAGGPQELVAVFRRKSLNLFGPIGLATPSHVFLLSTLSVDVAGKNAIVLVGEAAHAFPPIGAQGLNLSLRDVADLGAAMAAGGDAKAISEDYSRRRSGDLARTGGMVDTLFRSLLSDFLPAQAVRAGGLWALKTLPGLRQRAFGIGMGER